MRTGTSTLLFEAVEGWGRLPEGYAFGYTHGIVADANDRIYVLHTSKPNVVVFDRDGRFLTAWHADGIGDNAHGFYLHREQDGEYLYISDCNTGAVVKTTLQGEVVLRLDKPDLPDVYGEGKPYRPTDIAVAPNGDIYVTDGYGQNWIHRYSASGEWLFSWGGTGREPGRMKCPHGISVKTPGGEPELYVADRGNNRIQVFTLDGAHKRFIDHDMDRPCSFYFHGGRMYFPDLNSRVTIFDENDRLLTHLGEDQQAYKQAGWPNLPKSYYRLGRFSSPHGLCVDSQGDVYVAEWISDGRLTKLKRVNA
ncbi:MAG: repeat-containing protein [Paenibacillus sp.]|nr:repeat-containing protein [Paenibacillus sp.]